MFPSNSFSEFHLPYADKGPLAGRSYSPFDPTNFQLEEELIFEQLFFQEGQMDEARDDGGVNAGFGIIHTREEKNIDGTDQDVVRSVSSSDGAFVSKVWAGKKSRSKVAGSRKSKVMPRKRTGKKDRHSKIHTAQGLRDRRIRLSVHIARKFFDLQEMLGVDKASKTIEWLLAESHGAIDELFKKKLSPLNMDSTPESAVASETKEAEMEAEEDEERLERTRSKGQMAPCEIPIIWTRRDLRDKARQRARERTREKLMMKGINVEDPNKYREEGIKFDGSHDASRVFGPPKDPDCDSANDMNCLSIIEKFLGIKSTESKPDTYPDQNIRNIADFLEGLTQPRTPPNSFSVRLPNGQNW